jgi:hypothetical protein
MMRASLRRNVHSCALSRAWPRRLCRARPQITVTITAPAAWVEGAANYLSALGWYDDDSTFELFDYITAFLPGFMTISDPSAASYDPDIKLYNEDAPVPVRAGP